MPDKVNELRFQAGVWYFRLHLGLGEVSDLNAWADEEILRHGELPDGLLELSLVISEKDALQLLNAQTVGEFSLAMCRSALAALSPDADMSFVRARHMIKFLLDWTFETDWAWNGWGRVIQSLEENVDCYIHEPDVYPMPQNFPNWVRDLFLALSREEDAPEIHPWPERARDHS